MISATTNPGPARRDLRGPNHDVRVEQHAEQLGFAIASSFRAWVLLRMGNLTVAEVDARRAVELAEGTPLLAAILRDALHKLVELLVRRGELDVAEMELQRYLQAGRRPSYRA